MPKSSTTWWVGPQDLDDDQQRAIGLPIDESVLVTGPPGSGKTNLLLLRANFLYLAGKQNIAIIVFTRSLSEFIRAGAATYSFPQDLISTSTGFFMKLLRSFGLDPPLDPNFKTQRSLLVQEVTSLMDSDGFGPLFDAILVDEVQDYQRSEVELFQRLANQVFFAGDANQRIYDSDISLEEIGDMVDYEVSMRFHYRNGLEICRLADEVARSFVPFHPMVDACNYDEAKFPSAVRTWEGSESALPDALLSRIAVQIEAYPEDMIAVLAQRDSDLVAAWDAIASSKFADVAVRRGKGHSEPYPLPCRVFVGTVASAKGLEFRAVHLVGLSGYRGRNGHRTLFTALTRAKTVVEFYDSGSPPPFVRSILSFVRNVPVPSIKTLFGGSAS